MFERGLTPLVKNKFMLGVIVKNIDSSAPSPTPQVSKLITLLNQERIGDEPSRSANESGPK
jgi:hypothetical protein